MYPTRLLCAFSPTEYIQSAKTLLSLRPAKAIFDQLSPMPSHLLNVSLASHVPPACLSLSRPGSSSLLTTGLSHLRPAYPSASPAPVMFPGHFLVYFPPQIPSSDLMRDGTDADHAPGAPFVHRMWAGGSVRFDRSLKLDGGRAVCVEKVLEPVLQGAEGNEKVFVQVRRRYGRSIADADGEEGDERGIENVDADPAVEEVRRLVFMREREENGQAIVVGERARRRRPVKAKFAPEYSFTLTPDAKLLFHFSALTFNAHAIHLNRSYVQGEEGHRDLLVHGPLSLCLMLSAVQAHAGPEWVLRQIDYRNLAPLYVGEQMKVCLRADTAQQSQGGATAVTWDVWVEGPDGGMAVKGTVVTIKGE